MKGLVLYQAHNAMNLHFNPNGDYDYFKYNGKTRVNEDSFNKSRYKWQYAALEPKLEHVMWFLFQQFKKHDFKYVPPKALLMNGNKEIHKDDYFKHPIDYLNHVVKNDLKQLNVIHGGSTNLFDKGSDSDYPSIYDHYKQGTISIETLLLCDDYVKKVLDINLSNDIIKWPQVVRDLSSVQPFVEQMFSRYDFEMLFADHYVNNK